MDGLTCPPLWLARLRSWLHPPNWSRSQWLEELEQVAWTAACQAERDYDASTSTPYNVFVYHRVVQRAFARYRKERAYAFRFLPELAADSEDEDGTVAS